ncbi:hypothetical protein ACCO45_012324 [Purpureocillium lilacinum]|uniref:Uncharacterized protein n=1 Tax=Purpureocillium lilacinum TaxID=33203 RepID=A0ACC4D7P4_PURLI
MFPVSTSGLTGGVCRLVEFSGHFVDVAIRLKQSPDGMLAEMQEMKAGAESLEKTIGLLHETLVSGSDESLKAICLSANELAKELQAAIKSVQGRQNWEHSLEALTSASATNHSCRGRIMAQQQTYCTVNDIKEMLVSMNKNIGLGKIEAQGLEEPAMTSSTAGNTIPTTENHSVQLTGTTPTSSSQSTVHKVHISAKQSQISFIHANTPSRFRCSEIRCACSCHLNQYLKSPLFLKRFSFLGDTQGIKHMLRSGTGSLGDVDPNHGRSALHYAVMKNHVETCKFLLEAGADRFIEDESNVSATQKAWEHIFTKRGPPKLLETLAAIFPDDDLDYWMFTPLHKAVLGMEGLSLSQLLSSESPISDIDAVDTYQRTALHWAALRGDLEAVEALLTAGACVNVTDGFKCTPLLYAASAAVPRIVELLILSGANVNVTNLKGDSPLHYAARHKDDLASVEIFVRAGAQVDRTNVLGNTPFAGAAIMNRVATGKYLLKCGANRHSRNKYNDTPLRETIQHNCHGFLRMLLEVGTNCDDINKHGSSLLHALALEGDTKTISLLRDADLSTLDVELVNVQGYRAVDICQKRIGASDTFKAVFAELLTTISSNSTAQA